MLLTLHIDSLGKFLEGFDVTILTVLGHKQSSKGDVKRGIISVELFFGDLGLLASALLVIILITLKQVPICSNKEFLSLL